jgi:hypothetical protein
MSDVSAFGIVHKVYAETSTATPAEIKAGTPGRLHPFSRHKYKKAKSYTTFKDDEGTKLTGAGSGSPLPLPNKRVQRGKGQLL